MYPFYFDNTMVILIPAMILTMYAQGKINKAYSKFSRIRTVKGFTGMQTARAILDKNGLTNVSIELVGGKLSDHYDPRTKVLRLSQDVYYGNTIAANSIAAHEVGHAIQHAKAYAPLAFRNSMVPVVNIASNLSWFFILGGMFFSALPQLFTIGVLMFSASVVFQLVTLPVELNASSRAISLLGEMGILSAGEIPQGRKMLNAAALTYIAAASAAVAQLIRLLVLRDRNDR
ncbi:MAG: zinc metallopeptidase [Proteocatella sp.]